LIKGKLPVSLSLNNERSACIVGTFKREFKLPGVEEFFLRCSTKWSTYAYMRHVCRFWHITKPCLQVLAQITKPCLQVLAQITKLRFPDLSTSAQHILKATCIKIESAICMIDGLKFVRHKHNLINFGYCLSKMMALIALIVLLLSGNTQIFSAVKAGGRHSEEGGGGGGAGHRSALPRQEKTV